MDQPGEQEDGRAASCGSISRGQSPRRTPLLCRKSLSPMNRQTIPGHVAFAFFSSVVLFLLPAPDCHAASPLFSAKRVRSKLFLAPFFLSAQLKWFAAAKKKKISLFPLALRLLSPVVSLSLSVSLPPACLPLSLSLARCLYLNPAPFVLLPALVLKHRKCSNRADFLYTRITKKKRE